MGNQKEKVPILFIIFNRPHLALETFKSIRSYQPEVLYIAADGPREAKADDRDLCKQTRELILKSIDWNCDVHQLFRDQNIGCGRGVSEAISWMFEQEEYGIIIEDDCSPSIDFFKFCEELLPRYMYDEKIMQINGFNPISKLTESNSYTFSRYPRIWGWATWKRAWDKFDFYMEKWPTLKKERLHFKIFPLGEAIIHEYVWNNYYKELKHNNVPRTWDYQWSISIFFNTGLCIVPNVNLVRNTGMNVDATNYFYVNEAINQLRYGSLQFPLLHPNSISLNKEINSMDSKYYMKQKRIGLKNRILNIIRYK
jgi:hypothetical protein